MKLGSALSRIPCSRRNTSRTGLEPPHPRRDVRRGCVRRPTGATIPSCHSRRKATPCRGVTSARTPGRRPRHAVRFQATEAAIGGRAAVLRGAGPVAEERPATARRFGGTSCRLVVRGLRLEGRWRVDACVRRPPRLALLRRVDGSLALIARPATDERDRLERRQPGPCRTSGAARRVRRENLWR